LLPDRVMGVQVYILRGRYTASTCFAFVCGSDGDGNGDGDGNVDDNAVLHMMLLLLTLL
jgi:hypothetical protein